MNYDIFQKFRATIENQKVDRLEIEAAIEPICVLLNSYFYEDAHIEHKPKLFGSFVRGTAIPGVSCVDLLYFLPDHFRNFITANIADGPHWMRELLDRIFAGTQWTIEDGALSDAFLIANAKPWPIKITPVFYANEQDFITFKSLKFGSGQLFSPYTADKNFSAINFTSNGNLEILAKTVRYWVYSNQIPMSGFLVDCLAMSFIAHSPYRRFPRSYQDCLLRDFFKTLAETEPTRKSWTIEGTTDQVLRSGPFESAAERAYALTEQMIANSSVRQDIAADEALRHIIGNVAFELR